MSDDLPAGAAAFLADAGWGEADDIAPLPGDASARRYFRIRRGEDKALLMHAPPPDEDIAPFVSVADWLNGNGVRAPTIHAADERAGFLLQEDCGDRRIKELLEQEPRREEQAYRDAVDQLIVTQQADAGPFPRYDLKTYLRETDLFVDWFVPHRDLSVDRAGWTDAWTRTLTPLLARQDPPVTVLRDYHAENIMVTDTDEQVVIDFQDALVGHRAYDLVSLLQDARRDVSPEMENRLLAYFTERAEPGDDFEADYAVLGAQRNAKIVGIFTRLANRDGKQRYLELIPRVWRLMERDLAHPACAPVAQWFDANVPRDLRDRAGATT